MATIAQVYPMIFGCDTNIAEKSLVKIDHATGKVSIVAGVADGVTIGAVEGGVVAVEPVLGLRQYNKVVAGGTIAKGAFVKADANGKAVTDATGTATTNPRARTSAVAGQIIDIYSTLS